RPPYVQSALSLHRMAAFEKELVVHRQLPDLGPEPPTLVVSHVSRSALQRHLSASEKLVAPVRERPRSHAEITRNRVERFAPENREHRVRVPPRRDPPRSPTFE